MFLSSTIFRINETIMVLASSVELKKFYSITYLDYLKKTKIKFTLIKHKNMLTRISTFS